MSSQPLLDSSKEEKRNTYVVNIVSQNSEKSENSQSSDSFKNVQNENNAYETKNSKNEYDFALVKIECLEKEIAKIKGEVCNFQKNSNRFSEFESVNKKGVEIQEKNDQIYIDKNKIVLINKLKKISKIKLQNKKQIEDLEQKIEYMKNNISKSISNSNEFV